MMLMWYTLLHKISGLRYYTCTRASAHKVMLTYWTMQLWSTCKLIVANIILLLLGPPSKSYNNIVTPDLWVVTDMIHVAILYYYM